MWLLWDSEFVRPPRRPPWPHAVQHVAPLCARDSSQADSPSPVLCQLITLQIHSWFQLTIVSLVDNSYLQFMYKSKEEEGVVLEENPLEGDTFPNLQISTASLTCSPRASALLPFYFCMFKFVVQLPLFPCSSRDFHDV